MIRGVLSQQVKQLIDRKKIQRRSNYILNLTWAVFSTVGLVIHSIFMTSEYLMYPVTSQVTISFDESFKPPALSYCFTIVNSRIPNSFKDVCKDRIVFVDNRKKYWQCLNSIRSTRLNEVYNEHMMDLRKTVTRIELKDFKLPTSHTIKSYENKTLNPSLTRYFSRFMKAFEYNCIRFEYPNIVNEHRNVMKLHLISKFMPDKKDTIRITGSTVDFSDTTTSFLLFVHDAGTYPRGYLPHSAHGQFQFGFEGKYILYEIIKTTYLPPPFWSKCTKRYKKGTSDIESQDDCMERCIVKEMQKIQPKSVPGFQTITNDLGKGFLPE